MVHHHRVLAKGSLAGSNCQVANEKKKKHLYPAVPLNEAPFYLIKLSHQSAFSVSRQQQWSMCSVF